METLPAILEIHAEDELSLGPAMEALPSPKMRAFVYALIDTGGRNQTQCAEIAGYSGTGIRVTAYRLAHDERVQAAIHEQARKKLQAGAVLAVTQLLHLCETSSKDNIRLQAAGMILDRAGLHARTEHAVTVNRPENEKQMIREIAELAKQIGVDPKKLLGAQGIETVDADFEEVIRDGDSDEAQKPDTSGPVEDPDGVDWNNL